MSNLIATEHGLSRRMALQALALMTASSPALGQPSAMSLQRTGVKPAGTLTDPLLRDGLVPWPRTLSKHALQTLATLCDLILPADARSPSASRLGCHDFIDEWVSAPYPDQQQDNTLVLAGLTWIDEEAASRFGQQTFIALKSEQQREICDDICRVQAKRPALQAGTDFFARVRDLTAAAFWTTPAGMDDLGYIGNTPLPKWSLPPKEVLDHLKLKASDIP